MSVRGRFVGVLIALLLAVGVGRGEENHRVIRVYKVTDLVTMAEAAVSDAPSDSSLRQADCRRETSEERLIRQITSTIDPRSWVSNGGDGTIDIHPLTMALVVNQTPDVQEQIAGLLAALRRRQDVQVSCEVKFIEVSGELSRALKEQGLLGEPDNDREGRPVAFLDNDSVASLLEAVQLDARSNVLQAPKLTTFNGQNAGVRIAENHTFTTGLAVAWRKGKMMVEPLNEVVPLGILMNLRPVVSADRRCVRLRFDLKWNDLISSKVALAPITVPASPSIVSAPQEEQDADAKPGTRTYFIEQPRINTMSLHRTLTIPSGQTAVLTGLVNISESECKHEVPILSKLPGLGKLFCSTEVRCEARDVVVLVTPTVLREESEKKAEAKKHTHPSESVCRFRTRIIPPDCDLSTSNLDAPEEAQVLSVLEPPAHIPGVCEVSRENPQVVTERVSEKTDSPRMFPLVGPARLHRSHWKCTVYYIETIRGDFPLTFEWSRPRSEVVYLDCDCLELVSVSEDSPK